MFNLFGLKYLFISFHIANLHWMSCFFSSYEYKQIKKKTKRKKSTYSLNEFGYFRVHMGNVLFPGCVNTTPKKKYFFLEIWQRSHKSCLLIRSHIHNTHIFFLCILVLYTSYILILFNLGITNCLYWARFSKDLHNNEKYIRIMENRFLYVWVGVYFY